MSEKTKRKIGLANSISLKGRKVSNKVKIKISNSLKIKFKNIENHTAWKGGKHLDSMGYVYIYCKNHSYNKNSYIYEHRLVVENMIRRYLSRIETIHHINGIKSDNRPENLYLFSTSSEHHKYHNNKNKPILVSNIMDLLE